MPNSIPACVMVELAKYTSKTSQVREWVAMRGMTVRGNAAILAIESIGLISRASVSSFLRCSSALQTSANVACRPLVGRPPSISDLAWCLCLPVNPRCRRMVGMLETAKLTAPMVARRLNERPGVGFAFDLDCGAS